MAYTDPGAVSASSTGTSTWANAVRASIITTAPAVAAAEGDLFIATAANTVAALTIGTADSIMVAGADRPEWQIVPACHVTKSDSTNLTEDDWTSIEFDTETSDTDAMHSTVTNPSRLTIPTGGDGWYTFGFFATKTGNSPDRWAARILLNGATTLGQSSVSTYDTCSISVTAAYPLSATDYIEAQYYTGNADGVMSASPAFWAVWQRR